MTPLIKQYLQIKEQYKNTILLFQVGDFYEMFYDDAIVISNALNLILTKKNKIIPMCGFPISAIDTHIIRMIQQGFYIAICNQISLEDKLAVRKVIRVITPGTLMNEYIENDKPRLLVSVYNHSIACVDVNTGDFFIWSNQFFRDYIYNNNISEILCYGDIYKEFREQNLHTTYFDPIPLDKAKEFIELITYYKHLTLSNDEIISIGMVSYYLYATHNDRKFKPIRKIDTDKSLIISKKTCDALNITNELSKYFNRTKTQQGSRLFHEVFFNPIKDINEIKYRHSQIEKYSSYTIEEKIPDIESIFNRIIFRKTNELYKLAYGIMLSCKYIEKDYAEIKIFANELLNLFDEKNNIKNNFSSKGKKIIDEIEYCKEEMQKLYKFKIKHNNIIGYYIETNMNVPSDFIKKQSTSKSTRYTTSVIIEYEGRINILQNEFNKLKNEFIDNIIIKLEQYRKDIEYISSQIAQIDLYSSLYRIFKEQNFVKPEICEDEIFEIIEGRHPLINTMNVITNSCNLNIDKLWFVTGPNMGGKSVFLKQNAIFVYLAHIGFYIPAKHARIGIVDHLYTRIGADDDIMSKHSTFMLEMLDIAAITNNATKKSFVIIDELGRGTSFKEGRAISEAVINYLYKMKLRSIVSSHDTELKINNNIPRYTLYTMIEDDKLLFSYKLHKGTCTHSYGIYTAKIAGVSEEIINEAKLILTS